MKTPDLYGRVVYVKWIDSSSFIGTWTNLKDLKGATPTHCESVGFVMQHNDISLTLAGHLTPYQAAGEITIPIGNIVHCSLVEHTTTGPRVALHRKTK